MALNPQALLAQLSPAKGLDLSGMFGSPGQGTAREQLKLARERFEYEQKQDKEQAALERLKLKADERRRAALAEKQRLDREAEAQAKLLAQQQAGVAKFGELAGSGKVQQAQAMLPGLDQLGYDVNTLGDVGGLPVFQLQNRAQEAERQKAEQAALAGGDEMAGLGYPTNERGTLDEPVRQPAGGALAADASVSFEPGPGGLDEATADALTPGDADMATANEFGGDGVADVSVGRGMMPGSLSAGDAYAQALAASQAARDSGGRPARGPDEEDWQGAVPRNVIDLPAMQAETLARLNPALKARVEALPGELQPGAKANAEAIGGLGLEASDALKEMDTALEDPVSIYNQKLNIQAQKEKNNQLSPMDVSTLRTRGAEQAQKLATTRGVSDVLKAVKGAEVALGVLDDNDPNNDTMIAPALMDAQGVKGVPSNVDLAMALGMNKASTITQIVAKVEELVLGGMSVDQKNAIKNYLRAVQKSQKGTVDDYLNSAHSRLDSGELQSDEARGYRGALEESVPAWMYNEYTERRRKTPGAQQGGAGRNAPAGDAGDLDADKLGRVTGHESQGDPKATSVAGASGTMQIMPDNLRAMGIEPEDFKKLSAAEQMPYNIRYLKGWGITKDSSSEDYAMAVAAPKFIGKPAGTVVYPKDSDAWKQNPGWRPADGSDITVGSILKFYGLGGEKAASEAPSKAASKAPSELPEPKTAAEKRIVELLKKRGG